MNKTLILKGIQDSYNFKTKAQFADFLGVKPQTISSWYTRNTFDYDLLYEKLEGLNPTYLFTGIGNVKIDTHTYKVDNSMMDDEPNDEGLLQFPMMTDSILENQYVPLYATEAVAGIIPIIDNTEDQPIDFIKIPSLPKCDAAVHVVGDSMYPLLKSGDIVLFKKIEDFANDIFWGEMYILSLTVAGDNVTTVKYIQKSELGKSYVKLVSQNKHHQDKDIKISKIRGLGLIKASIRINSMN